MVELLDRTGTSWSVVEELLSSGAIAAVRYRGEEFYLKRYGRLESQQP